MQFKNWQLLNRPCFGPILVLRQGEVKQSILTEGPQINGKFPPFAHENRLFSFMANQWQ